jgi:hypothetical protein
MGGLGREERLEIQHPVSDRLPSLRWNLHTSAHSDTFRGTKGKVYHFRARVLNPDAGKATDWSPSKKVTT